MDSPLLFSQVEFTLGKADLEAKLLLMSEFFVLFIQDMFVNGGILLAPCYMESTRAVLPVGLSMKILLDK